MHKVFCIIGRTASGKSTIVSAVAKDMKLKVLKSYTTRARRKNEVGKHCDHTFISADDVNKYMQRLTQRVVIVKNVALMVIFLLYQTKIIDLNGNVLAVGTLTIQQWI